MTHVRVEEATRRLDPPLSPFSRADHGRDSHFQLSCHCLSQKASQSPRSQLSPAWQPPQIARQQSPISCPLKWQRKRVSHTPVLTKRNAAWATRTLRQPGSIANRLRRLQPLLFVDYTAPTALDTRIYDMSAAALGLATNPDRLERRALPARNLSLLPVPLPVPPLPCSQARGRPVPMSSHVLFPWCG